MLIRYFGLFYKTFQHFFTFICNTLQNCQLSGTETDSFRVLRQYFCGKLQIVCGVSFLECMPNQYAKKYFRSSLMLPKTYPLLSNYSTCLSPMSTLSLNWGMLLLEPLFGTPMMATLGSFPQIQIFQTFQTRSKRQNRAGNPTHCPCYFSH